MTGGDLGLFGPESITWRVHSEPILMLAGLRSLFLQALHPRAIAGVVQNSGYKADPWGRLMRTVQYVATTVYGTTEQAAAAGKRVRAIHARLTATDPRSGEVFRVDDPALLLWVHVTEVESFLDTARRAGVSLSPEEVDRYYAEQRQSAALVGLNHHLVPATARQVQEYYRAIRPELAMTKEAAETLAFLLVPPMKKYLIPLRLAYGGVAATAFGLMPAWARRIYGFPGLPTTDLSASISVRVLRMGLKTVPHKVFEGPIYKAAMQRAALRTAPSRG